MYLYLFPLHGLVRKVLYLLLTSVPEQVHLRKSHQ
jgi:hypothetical protein